MRAFAALALALSPVLALVACPGAQVKNSSGDVKVVLRRIDVAKANYDKMKLNVIVAVENGTADDVVAAGNASIAVTGEADGAEEEGAEESAEGAQEEGEAEGGQEEGEAEEAAAGAPVDGKRYSGTGGGTAPAFNTSELPIVVELPLPDDPAVLEQMLAWPKMLVDVEGTVTVGGVVHKISGTREVAPPHLPEVRLKEAQIASQDDGASGAGFFTLLLDNKNPFPVTVNAFSYKISIKDKELRTNEITGDEVPASAVAEYQATVDVDEKAFGKDLKALLKAPSVPYVVEGEVEVRGIKKPFRFAGEMNFPR